jgi:hypothetical protein
MGNAMSGRAARARTPRGGGELPEGRSTRTGGRGPASVRVYGGASRYGGAAHAWARPAL